MFSRFSATDGRRSALRAGGVARLYAGGMIWFDLTDAGWRITAFNRWKHPGQ